MNVLVFMKLFNNNIHLNNYLRLCFSELRLVARPVAVHDAHNQSERQVATFVANFAVFQQRVSAMLEASQRGNTSNLTKHVTNHEAIKT